jgi:hypothetical protein
VVATVKVEDPPAGLGLNVPVAPVGNPLMLNVTALLKPFVGLIVMP